MGGVLRCAPALRGLSRWLPDPCRSSRHTSTSCPFCIWAALQELPMELSSCLEDCQASRWLGRDHAVAGGHALDDLGCP